jgi:hypothetical protein
VARNTGCRVSVLNTAGGGARRKILELLQGVDVNLVEQKLSYPEYLKLIAGHRLVLQRDVSHVPGQVAGDALLCRVLNLGGNGSVQQIAFPQYSAISDDDAALAHAAKTLIEDDAAYLRAVEHSQALAQARLSFRAGRERLAAIG